MNNNEKKEMGNNGRGMFIGLIIGAAIGIAAGFLYAPKAGKETRKIISDKVNTAKDKTVEMVRQIKKAGRAEVIHARQ